jgi:hypothetical protein
MHMSAFMIFPLAVMVTVCALALARGGPPERLGAVIVLGTMVGVELIHMLAPQDMRSVLLLGIDGLIAGGFLLIALRYTSLWLGGAMLLQAVQFSLHAYYLVTQQRLDHNYKTINNIDSFGVLLFILVGTVLSWRKRAQAAK